MSRHRFTTKDHTILVGWDNPLQTFFAQVWPLDKEDEEDEPLFWTGSIKGEVATVDALTGLLRPYAEIPAEIASRLREDFERKTPPTPLQVGLTEFREPVSSPFANAELIYAYTRAQALADGVLVDVTETAREAGFCYPVALTRAVWSSYVEVPAGVEAQDEAGRLWDILCMLRYAVKREKEQESELRFQLWVRNDNRMPELVSLRAVCGPADDGSPCLTVLLPGED